MRPGSRRGLLPSGRRPKTRTTPRKRQLEERAPGPPSPGVLLVLADVSGGLGPACARGILALVQSNDHGAKRRNGENRKRDDPHPDHHGEGGIRLPWLTIPGHGFTHVVGSIRACTRAIVSAGNPASLA